MKIQKLKVNRTDILPICFIGSISTSLLISSLTLIKINSLNKQVKNLNNLPPTTLYQSCQGEAELANHYSPESRRDELVEQYVRNWVEKQFTWSGKIKSDGTIIDDPGFDIDGQTVPTAAYEASFAFPPKLARSYLKFLAKNWVPKNYFSQQPTVTKMLIKDVSPVKKISAKNSREIRYSIGISGQFLEYNSTKITGSKRTWNRRIILSSIPPPINPPKETSSAYEILSYQWLKYGLRIVDIKSLKTDE